MKTSNPNILSRIPRQQLWGFYIKLYSGGELEFIEGDVFRTIVPLNDVSVGIVGPKQGTNQDTVQDTNQDTVQEKITASILEFCVVPRSRKEIQEFVGLSNRGHFNKAYLKPLIEEGRLKMTIPEAPNSRNQKYVVVNK